MPTEHEQSIIIIVLVIYQLMAPMATPQPLAKQSNGGEPTMTLASKLPDDATTTVITHDATGCLKANSMLPAINSSNIIAT